MSKVKHKEWWHGKPVSMVWLPTQETITMRPLEIAKDGGLIVTDDISAFLHNEKFFVFYHTFTLTSGNKKDFIVKTGTTSANLLVGGQIDAASKIRIYDAPVISDNGTEIAGYNSVFGDDVNSPTTQIFHTPTITGDGTSKDRDVYYAGKKPGDENMQTGKKIIKPNRNVLIRVHADANLSANIKFFICEPDA